MKDNAWFVGFAPREAPEIVVAALFENGEHGHFAAPIVRDVLKAYFDKKIRLAQVRMERSCAAERRELPLRARSRDLIETMATYRSLRDFDWPMFILAFAICSMGVLQIFSATHDTKWSDAWWKQVVYIVCAIAGDVGGHPDRLSHAAGPGPALVHHFRGHPDRHVSGGNQGFRLAPLDWIRQL